jgi:hypothetical protein
MITLAAATNALLDLSPDNDYSPTTKTTSNINGKNTTTSLSPVVDNDKTLSTTCDEIETTTLRDFEK